MARSDRLTTSETELLDQIGRTAPDLYLATLVELETSTADLAGVINAAFKKMRSRYAASSEAFN